MSLTAVLRSTEGLADLPRLVAEFGHEPLWEELPPWPDVRRAATVGRHGRFLWIGAESGRPVNDVVRRIANRYSTNGCAAGVLVVYPPGRELGIALGLGQTSTLRVDLNEPSPAAVASLRRLRGLTASSASGFAARGAEALTGRGLGHEFFRQFRVIVGQAADAVTGRDLRDAAHRRSLALLQLTRVLFLYFVQSRGWLDGHSAFLRRAVDECLGRRRSLQRHLFDPLFFGTLNRAEPARSRGVRAFGAIPFLNGGLFEPHPLERRYSPALPDSMWRDAFDQLFERYHFTVSESDASEMAIAPDMLGRVFEGVMEPADRKASGTFYTPAPLVGDVMDTASAALVAARLGCSDAEAAQRLERSEAPALAVLVSATLLDPACGSGAFLLGALERLAAARAACGEPAAGVRRSVLRSQLFGVDLSGMAVRLAELRLWLAVAAHDEASDPRAVQPLPNLDCLVRQGDSLREPDGARILCSPDLARAAGLVRRRLVDAVGGEKHQLADELRRLESAAAAEAAMLRESRAVARVRELLVLLRAPTLFGDRAPPSAEERRGLRTLRRELRDASAARRAACATGEVPWFHFESHFPDVMARGGFDLVVGNPPWVRAEEVPASARDRLAARFRWWRAPSARGFAHRPDLAVAFLERAHELVAKSGVVALVVPAKIATAEYGAAARAALVRETTIHAAADLTGEARARFGATVYPMVLVTSRRSAPPGHSVRHALEPRARGTEQVQLGAAPWAPARPDAAGAVARIRSGFPAFGSRFVCRLGVKTGANDVFLDPPGVPEALLRPALRGRDVGAFSAASSSRILWTHDANDLPLAALPPGALSHLARHEARLRARTDYAGGPWWMLFRTRGALMAHRVIWADLARTLAAAVPAADAVALNSCYVTAAPSRWAAHAAAAWLNSTWIRGAARLTASRAAGGFARFAASVVAQLPAPPDDDELAELGESGARGKHVQEEIDDRVARILDLGVADRRALAAVAGSRADDRR